VGFGRAFHGELGTAVRPRGGDDSAGSRPVTKKMTFEYFWDYSFDPEINLVDVLVHRLRAFGI
jgi:hypothetical protein